MNPEREIADDCVGARLRRLNRIVTSLYDEALRPFGLRLSQLDILASATIHEPARPAELCRRLELDPSTLSRNLQILHRNGWIEYLEDSSDARAQPFRVTTAGRELIERAHPAWKVAQEQAEQALGPEVCRALRSSSDAVCVTATSTPAQATTRS
jgi:DNA-binding MarR family transcriptional regulator